MESNKFNEVAKKLARNCTTSAQKLFELHQAKEVFRFFGRFFWDFLDFKVFERFLIKYRAK